MLLQGIQRPILLLPLEGKRKLTWFSSTEGWDESGNRQKNGKWGESLFKELSGFTLTQFMSFHKARLKKETGSQLVTNTQQQFNPHYQSNTGRHTFSTAATEVLWYTRYLCRDSVPLLKEIDTLKKEPWLSEHQNNIKNLGANSSLSLQLFLAKGTCVS